MFAYCSYSSLLLKQGRDKQRGLRTGLGNAATCPALPSGGVGDGFAARLLCACCAHVATVGSSLCLLSLGAYRICRRESGLCGGLCVLQASWRSFRFALAGRTIAQRSLFNGWFAAPDRSLTGGSGRPSPIRKVSHQTPHAQARRSNDEQILQVSDCAGQGLPLGECTIRRADRATA